MKIVPLSLKQASQFVDTHHRHHSRPQGYKFAIGVKMDELHGVAICGRPIARHSDDGLTIEVTRLCTDGTKNACSKLYSACARVAREMGYKKIITFILQSETGISLKATGWSMDYKTRGKSWSVKSRPRQDKHELGVKIRYSKSL